MVYEYTSLDGIKILVGENAKDNQQLTFSSDPTYWWMHATGKPGPHVVICHSGDELPRETKRDAMHLATKTSGLVTITRVGFVSKTRMTGKVLVDEGTSTNIYVKIDPSRISHLKVSV